MAGHASVAVRHRRITAQTAVLVAAVLGTALAYMSDDMLNLAVPAVARDLDVTTAGVQWILNAYYVPLVAFVLIAGALGDMVGHRRVFVTGLMLFSAGALGCATAGSVAVFVAARLVQGTAAAMLLAAGLALVSRAHTPATRDVALGRFFGAVAAVPALGPFVSGALVDALSWRWLFVVPLVLPLGALLVTRATVPETARAQGRRPDVAGCLAALVALGGLSVTLIVGRSAPTGAASLAGAAAAMAGAAWFVVAERRATHPLVPLRFFRRRRFVGANAVWLLACMTSWGAVFFLAVALQAVLGLRPVTAGLVLTPIYVVMMAGSPLAGAMAGRVGSHRLVTAGLIVYAAGLWLLGDVSPASTVFPDVLVPLGVFAVGMASINAPLAAATMNALDEGDQGVASGVNNAMGQLAGLLAVVVLPAVAGLAAASEFTGPAFAASYPRALRAAAVIAAAAIPLAAVTLRPVKTGN